MNNKKCLVCDLNLEISNKYKGLLLCNGCGFLTADLKISNIQLEKLYGKDYFEDLSPDSFRSIIKEIVSGDVPASGSQTGRFSSEPQEKLTSLEGISKNKFNASVTQAVKLADTIKRIK